MRKEVQHSAVDLALTEICGRFATDIAALTHDAMLREGLLKAVVSRIVKTLEREFDGYQDILSASLMEHSDLVTMFPKDNSLRGVTLHH